MSEGETGGDGWRDDPLFPRKPGRDERPPFDLAGYVPYLLNRAGSRIADAFTAVAKREGLTLSMWRVLAALDACEPQAVTELARNTSIEVSTLSRMLDQMDRKDLVRRHHGFGDRRQVMILRSRYGALLTERLVPVALAFEAAATAGFNEAEKATLQGLLRRLYDNLDGIDRQALDRAG